MTRPNTQAELPLDVFGFPTDKVLELGQALDHMHTATGGMFGSSGGMVTGAVELFPLVERFRDGEPVDIHELSSHEEAIRNISPLLAAEESVLRLLSVIPRMETLGRIVFGAARQRHVEPDLAAILGQSSAIIPRIEPYVELLAGFENPRAAFVGDIRMINRGVLSVAAQRRSDFGAKEVAVAVHEVASDVIEEPEDSGVFPLVSGLLAVRQHHSRQLRLPPQTVIAMAAPEILTALAAPLTEVEQVPDIIEQVRSHPVAVAHVAHLFRGNEFKALRTAAPVLLTSFRDLLPDTGQEISSSFEKAKEFLEEIGRIP